MGMALCGMVLNQYFFIIGIQYTAPANGCVIATSTPVFTLLLSALLYGQRITWTRGAGVALASMGAVFLIMLSATTGGIAGGVKGDVFCVISQLSAACYFVFFGRVIQTYKTIALMKWLFSISSLIAVCLFGHQIADVPWADICLHEWLSCAYIVFIGTFICYLLLIYGQKRLSPQL